MLIFQNNTILWTKKMDLQTFIFAPRDRGPIIFPSLLHIGLRLIKHN